MNLKQLFPNASKSFYNANKTRFDPPRIHSPQPLKQTRTLVNCDERKAQSSRLPSVRFILCRTRPLDPDAKFASVKNLLDGLQYAGLIPGDRENQISLQVDQIKVPHRSQHQTVIEIEWLS